MKRYLLAVCVVIAGCGSQPSTSVSAPPKSAEKFSGVIDYEKATRRDHRGVWQASGYQQDGEEKIIFSNQVEAVAPVQLSDAELIITGPKADADAVNSMLKSLRLEARRSHLPVKKYGLAPFGLTNDFYFGHTFWDMDVWMLPALLFFEPNAVRDMAQYRLDRVEQAGKNYADFLKETKRQSGGSGGLKFPWESSVTGKETVPGPSREEHHISGSVLWGLSQAEALGLADSSKVKAVENGVATFFRARSDKTSRGYEIKNVMSPDEHHVGDNDLYTNLLAEWAISGRAWPAKGSYYLPKDAQSFLTYDNDALRGYKQAAAVLSIFPLQYPPAEKQARVMMDRFEKKVIKNGPAMTDSVHATIWARLGEKEKAYEAWNQCWQPFYFDGLFSEKSSRPRTYFYTGAAGCLNTVIYGFAGLRIDRQPVAEAIHKRKLSNGYWLSIVKPCLPTGWEKIELKNVQLPDGKFNITLSAASAEIRRL